MVPPIVVLTAPDGGHSPLDCPIFGADDLELLSDEFLRVRQQTHLLLVLDEVFDFLHHVEFAHVSSELRRHPEELVRYHIPRGVILRGVFLTGEAEIDILFKNFNDFGTTWVRMNVTSYFLCSLPMISYLNSYFVLSGLVIKEIHPRLLFRIVYHREFL